MDLWYVARENAYYNLATLRHVRVVDIFMIYLTFEDGAIVNLTGNDAEELCGHLQTQVPRSQQIEHFGEEDA